MLVVNTLRRLDRVSEAYYGQQGDKIAKKTRERIHWVCSKVEGKSVLNVGCSQGIMELILAKEGKQAVGIDIEEQLITYANSVLENESDTVKLNVKYHACSVFDFECNHKFDTLILSEIMQHFTTTDFLLKKIKNLLNDSGTIVITVPFGISSSDDNKKTYYLMKLLREVEPYFEVQQIEFLSDWVGLVGRKLSDGHERRVDLSRELIREVEETFSGIEQRLVNDITSMKLMINDMELKLTNQQEMFKNLQKDYENLKSENQKLKKENDFIQSKLTSSNEEKLATNRNKIGELEKVVQSKNEEIIERLDSEEETLKKFRDSIFQYNQLEAKYANISKKYNLLSNAKLGRLTLRYWKYKKRIPKDF